MTLNIPSMSTSSVSLMVQAAHLILGDKVTRSVQRYRTERENSEFHLSMLLTASFAALRANYQPPR
jgi:hypothetical protein